MISLNEGGGPPATHAPELTAAIFAEGGWLAALPGVEHRPEQERMARAVATAFAGTQGLLCEAGTGVGKSLAYLVPGLIHALDTRRQFLVSTHTKILQEQLRDQDLPKVRALFAATPRLAPYRDFTSAVLMGKSNYLCTTRLARALADRRELFQSPEQTELARVAAWARTTEHGLLGELQPRLSPDVCEEVSADSDACSAKHCTDGTCFYRRAKARRDAAHLLIVNHSLLFTLLAVNDSLDATPAAGLLRAGDFGVLDEAHTVPDIATDHLGLTLGSTGLHRLLLTLYHPEKTRGLFVKHDDTAAARVVEIALAQAGHFFAGLAEKFLTHQPLRRIREPDPVEDLLAGPLQAVLARLDHLVAHLPEGVEQSEVAGKVRRLTAYRQGLAAWLSQARADHVHWLEAGGRRQLHVQLRAAPLDVSAELRRRLFGAGTPVVLTSATLATGGSLAPFRRRVGADHAAEMIERSPFDFARHMRVYVATDIPEPAGAAKALNLDAITDYVRFCTLATPGGSLVLFTSYRDLQAVAARLAPDYAAAGRPCFTQEAGVAPATLIARLRTAGNGVLFGTDSFWTGIDVPGPALAQVVITRLPFEPPTHPVAEARAEWVAARGENPFVHLALPEALGKFRQGVGRLIRSHADRGVITILDPRILTKSYGRDFLASLPHPAHARLTREDRAAVFRPFP